MDIGSRRRRRLEIHRDLARLDRADRIDQIAQERQALGVAIGRAFDPEALDQLWRKGETLAREHGKLLLARDKEERPEIYQ